MELHKGLMGRDVRTFGRTKNDLMVEVASRDADVLGGHDKVVLEGVCHRDEAGRHMNDPGCHDQQRSIHREGE